MHIEVVTIGDELLLGYTIDTNAAHLARALRSAGYPPYDLTPADNAMADDSRDLVDHARKTPTLARSRHSHIDSPAC